jgi:hypothetical protein
LFAFNEVIKAIQPPASLGAIIENWKEIAIGLSETTRKRKSQVEKHNAMNNETS